MTKVLASLPVAKPTFFHDVESVEYSVSFASFAASSTSLKCPNEHKSPGLLPLGVPEPTVYQVSFITIVFHCMLDAEFFFATTMTMYLNSRPFVGTACDYYAY